jgi:hypothetical protein
MGNLSWQIDKATLQEAMRECSSLTDCKWVVDCDRGRTKGSDEEVQEASILSRVGRLTAHGLGDLGRNWWKCYLGNNTKGKVTL